VARFTTETGIKVNQQILPYQDLMTKIATSFTANAYFADVIDVDPFEVAGYGKQGWLSPLDSDLTPSWKSDLGGIGSFNIGGKQLAVPSNSIFSVNAINMTHLNSAGITKVPQTLDELMTDMKAIKDKGTTKYPLGIPLIVGEGLSENWYQVTAGFGGPVLTKDGKPNFVDPSSPGYKALAWLVSAYKSGLVQPGAINQLGRDQRAQFAAGTISAIFGSFVSGQIESEMEDPAKSKVVGQARYMSPGGVGIAPGFPGSDALGIPKTAKNRAGAVEFLKWFTNAKNQATWAGTNPSTAITGYGLPASVAAYGEVVKPDTENHKFLLDMAKNHIANVFPGGTPVDYSKFSRAASTAIHQAALGAESVDQAVKDIAQSLS
jgi:multiple sugar transport system substrate-binding protein